MKTAYGFHLHATSVDTICPSCANIIKGGSLAYTQKDTRPNPKGRGRRARFARVRTYNIHEDCPPVELSVVCPDKRCLAAVGERCIEQHSVTLVTRVMPRPHMRRVWLGRRKFT